MVEQLNPKSPVPLHLQLEKILRKKIADGVWTENEMIPSENELSRCYNLSRMTVRNVITRLSQEGILYRVQGKGTFVSEKKILSRPLSYMGIREQLERKGYSSDTKLLYIRKQEIDEKLMNVFCLSEDSIMFKIARLRSVKDLPFSLHISWIPLDLCPDLPDRKFDYENIQLCDILKENYQIIPNKIIETLEIVNADKEKAEQLKVNKGYPLLHLEDTIFGIQDKVVEYSSVFFRGDRIKLEILDTYH